jgi:hypothetical protein
MLDHLDPSTGARFFRQHWNLKEQKRLEVHWQQERKKSRYHQKQKLERKQQSQKEPS